MPTYDYECTNPECGDVFEHQQGMTEDKLVTCKNCGQDTLRRLIGRGQGITFKGEGFHEVDQNKSWRNAQRKPSKRRAYRD
jgi:putative FmdB family regulatory protein